MKLLFALIILQDLNGSKNEDYTNNIKIRRRHKFYMGAIPTNGKVFLQISIKPWCREV